MHAAFRQVQDRALLNSREPQVFTLSFPPKVRRIGPILTIHDFWPLGREAPQTSRPARRADHVCWVARFRTRYLTAPAN